LVMVSWRAYYYRCQRCSLLTIATYASCPAVHRDFTASYIQAAPYYKRPPHRRSQYVRCRDQFNMNCRCKGVDPPCATHCDLSLSIIWPHRQCTCTMTSRGNGSGGSRTPSSRLDQRSTKGRHRPIHGSVVCRANRLPTEGIFEPVETVTVASEPGGRNHERTATHSCLIDCRCRSTHS
jgi:hypothetical protein